MERAAGGVLSRTGLAWAPGVERAGRASPPLRRPPSTVAASLALGAPLSSSLSFFLCVGLSRGALSLSPGAFVCRGGTMLTCLSLSLMPRPLAISVGREQEGQRRSDQEAFSAGGKQRKKRERKGQRKREVWWKRGPSLFPFPILYRALVPQRPHRDMTRESSESLWFQGPKVFVETSTKARKWL